jgi:glutamate racemase
MKGAIGVFDSGIGGLTVLKEIVRLLPGEDTIYLGDTARVPYGTKSPETVAHYSIENTSFLIEKGLKVLVVACNTASAFALAELKKIFPLPIIGVIEPGARKAVEVSEIKRIGVIGTEGTIKSDAYFEAIKSIDDDVQVFSKACPIFVPLAEEGWIENDVAILTAETYLKKFEKKSIDTLVLGCTHYPILKETIKKVVGQNILLVDSAEESAKEVKKILNELGELSPKKEPCRQFFTTDSAKRFEKVGRYFFGDAVKGVEQVNIVVD